MADIVQNETGGSIEESEYGDFQTSEQQCNNFDKSVIGNPPKNIQPMMNLDKTVHQKQPPESKSKNVFAAGVDWEHFREFRQKFETNIVKHFQSGQQPPLSSEQETSDEIREDPINDCLIWQNLTTTCDINLYLKPDKALVLKRFLENCLEQIENRKTTIRANQRHPSNESLRCWNEDEIAQSLDMHSMMIGDAPEADDIIGKEEQCLDGNKLVQINRFNDGGNKFPNQSGVRNRCQIDQSLLSLNASTLLKTFHDEYGLGYDDIDEENGDDDNDDDDRENSEPDVDDSQYYSLPINLNHNNHSNSNNSNHPQKAQKYSLTGRKYSNDYSSDGMVRKLPKIQIHHNPDGSYEYCLDKISIIRTIRKDEKQYSSKELSEKIAQLNYITQLQSDVLQMELSTRNDLEYEKELKNQFISLLLRVQNKRRIHSKNAAKCDQTGGRAPTTTITTNKIAIIKHLSLDSILPMFHGSHGIMKLKNPTTSPKTSTSSSSTSCDPNFKPIYLIPYIDTMFPLDVQTLQTLIEILVAMDNDSGKVPELITNYILKVICPA